MNYEAMMKIALEEAEKAYGLGEVPVGASVFQGDKLITSAHNAVEKYKDASLHAEVLALKKAAEVLGDWRLKNCTLCVTLEPCTMCIGAIKLFRVSTVIFAINDPEKGACGSLFDLSQDQRLGPNPKVVSGVCGEQALKLLQDFFKEKRSLRK